MVTDPFDIVDHMEQRTDASAVINGQSHLANPNQIIRDGVIHKIDLLFHRIDFLNLAFVQADQRVKCPVEVLIGKRSHMLQFHDRLDDRRRGRKHGSFANIVQLVLRILRLLLSWYCQISQLYNPSGKRK